LTLEGRAHPPWVDGRAIADIVHSFLSGKDPLAPESSPEFRTGRAIDCRLDEANRELVLEGRHKPATPLEYGVMLALVRASGRVMTRDEMLAEVWKTSIAGSNRVEAVVRLLRKKLGAFAPSIETVTGHGYRFSGWKRRT
jgi:DNA-binding response OmpR family regulator